jgi:hypothetical protein
MQISLMTVFKGQTTHSQIMQRFSKCRGFENSPMQTQSSGFSYGNLSDSAGVSKALLPNAHKLEGPPELTKSQLLPEFDYIPDFAIFF